MEPTSWKHDLSGLYSFFSDEEVARLESARRQVDASTATIVYSVYENPFAKSGGIFAVADFYLQALLKAGRDVLLLSPYHSRLVTVPCESDVTKLADCSVQFDGRSVATEVFEHRRNGARWILVKADGFFEAQHGSSPTDPYVHADDHRLLIDSLFFSQAIPQVLAALHLTQNILLHVQDWELAATALTVKCALLDETLESAALVLTSHNPYDHELLISDLHSLTQRGEFDGQDPPSVYQQMIPLFDAPVTTVSTTFAAELTSDPLQTEHFTNHLQHIFHQQGLVGVNNGLFGQLKAPFSDEAYKQLSAKDSQLILREKLAKRTAMLELLAVYQDERILGTLDGGQEKPLAELPDDIPVYLMFGRMDPGQKGFDVLLRAIEQMPRGSAKFILTPIVTDFSDQFYADMCRVAQECAGDVAIYPFRMQQGYMEAMAGATFAVMPSLYEPFGGATEPYLSGTPVIARATGGLVQQIVDVRQDQKNGTGLLFRETTGPAAGEWRQIQTTHNPQERMAFPCYQSMVNELVSTLTHASEVYRNDSHQYASMLANLHVQAQEFSWEKTIAEYQAVYELATS
jgi:glycogen synthase